MDVIKLCLSPLSPKQKLRLIPFFITTTSYLAQPYPHNTLVGVIFKILPMISLIIFVMMDRSQFPVETRHVSMTTLMPRDTYSAFILFGLIFSMMADVLVTNQYTGLLGVLLFVIAHTLYIFGISESGRHIGVQSSVNSLFVFLFIDIYLLVQGCVDGLFWKGFLFAYFVPLFLAAWKAAAAYKRSPHDKACIFACIGALSFIFSDTLIVLYHSHCFRIPLGVHIYMFTYYLAQLGWALSTSDDKKVTTLS